MDIHEKLLKTLDKVDSSGEVCTSGDLTMRMPGLTVNDLGEIALPLNNTQAQQLIKQCHQAPYGKGIETVVDTKVRNAWELDPKQFELTNPHWEAFIQELVKTVQQELGLENHQLSAHLYKLLVYEKGSFFLPHRDGEKLDNMVATMVIALPSVYEGGELIVSHAGEKHEIVFEGAKSGYYLSYAAFYADCQHEIKPLKSGHRLCLTYNLTLATSTSRGKKAIALPSSYDAANEIKALLDVWSNNENNEKIAIVLDHQYTEKSLSLDVLKGIDRAKADILFAATQEHYIAHLALLTFWQSGTAEGGSYSYYDYNDEGDYEMDEIIDETLSVNHWSNRQGEKVQFGEIILNESDVITEQELLARDPDEEEFEGYTGNAGMTLDRWYHRAAIVIWSRQDHFKILCQAGMNAAIAGLKLLVDELDTLKQVERKKKYQDCLTFAKVIINEWEEKPRRRWGANNNKGNEKDFVRLLQQLDDPALVRLFFTKMMIHDGDIQLNSSFCQWLKKHGWENFEAELITMIKITTAKTANRNAQLLALICSQNDKNAERIAICHRLSHQLINELQALDKKPVPSGWQAQTIERSSLLKSLISAMLVIEMEKPLATLVDHTLNDEKKYELIETHLATLYELESQLIATPSAAISHWLADCRQQLEKRTAKEPKAPTDYHRNSKLSCHCADCLMLSAFLDNPTQEQGRFPLAKKRRQHLHNIINYNRCDCTHVTERTGSPFKLVCTKTTDSYTAVKKIYESDLTHLSRIIEIQKKRKSHDLNG